MACRISEIVLKAREPEAPARSWCVILGFVVLERPGEGCIEIGPREGGPQPTIFLISNDGPKTGNARLDIDVNPTDRGQDAELRRILAAGAGLVDVSQRQEATWHVLTDPEGNECCLLKTRLDPL